MSNKSKRFNCKCADGCGNVLVLEGTSVRVEGPAPAKGHSVILSKGEATKVAKALYATFRGAKEYPRGLGAG